MSSIRETSIDAYHEVVEEGRLAESRLEVYQTLLAHGPMTASELERVSNNRYGHQRLSELRTRGLAAEVGKRPCQVTGRVVIVWAAVRPETKEDKS